MVKIFLAILIIFQVTFSDAAYDGTKAKKQQFPYAVYITNQRFFCAGALISDRYVLTAAHCLDDSSEHTKVKVFVGSRKHYYDGKEIYSDKYWKHENFTMPSAVYDIGIIELPQRLSFNERTKALKISTKLNADLDDDDDREIYSAGWGHFREYSGSSPALRYTNMTLISLDECKKFKSHYIEDLNENHICTEVVKGTPCDGDSGGAIVSRKTNEIIGILSYVKDAENGVDMKRNDCRTKVPVVSTRISSYLPWISEKTSIEFENDNDIDESKNVIEINDNTV